MKEGTIGELKKLIKDLPDDMLVALGMDPEGNQFSLLSGSSDALFLDEGNGRGDIWIPGANHPNDRPEGGVRALFLFPT